MKLSISGALITLICISVICSAQDRVKVQEGRYATLKNGNIVPNSEHDWTLWRKPSGQIELEDRFKADQAQAVALLMMHSGAPLSAEFKSSIEKLTLPNSFSAVLDGTNRILALQVDGVTSDAKQHTLLRCRDNTKDFQCEGMGGKSKPLALDSGGFLWLAPTPFLSLALQSWSGGTGPSRKIVFLSFNEDNKTIAWGRMPVLQIAEMTITSIGPENLKIGDKTFRAQKQGVEVRGRDSLLFSHFAWTDGNGLLLAHKASEETGEMVALVAFKRYETAPTK